MNALYLGGCLALFGCCAFAEEKPVKLAPVGVTEKPFGTLGLDATARTTMLAFVTKDAKIKSMSVTSVIADSIAERAGIKVKDEVLSIDGVVVSKLSIRQLIEIWHQKEVGDLVRFQIYRPSTKESRFVDLRVETKKPNKAPEPTTLAVTPRAEPRVAPARVVAHL